MLAPHARLCAAVTAYGRDATETDAPPKGTTPTASTPGAQTACYHWAILLARRFATFPLLRDAAKGARIGENGRAFMAAERGALDKLIEAVDARLV